ncbi:hypothetical protein LguiA_035244 [Lonicera macranthoides]
MVIQLALATDYTVGGPTKGWDSVNNLQGWASSQPFSIGDNLIIKSTFSLAVFQYGPNHNVIEVTKADFDSCQATNALQTYTDGATTIPLAAPGKRYFICGTPGHCSQGMKVEVDTLEASAPPLAVATPSTDELPVSLPTFGPTLSPISPFVPPVSGLPLSPSGALEPPPVSSAAQVKLVTGSTMGFGLVMVMILVV